MRNTCILLLTALLFVGCGNSSSSDNDDDGDADVATETGDSSDEPDVVEDSTTDPTEDVRSDTAPEDTDPGDSSEDPDPTDVGDSDVADVDATEDVADVDDSGDVTEVGDAGDATDVGDVADVDDTNDVSDVGDTSDAGDADDTSDSGDVTDVADSADAEDASMCPMGESACGDICCGSTETCTGGVCCANTRACGDECCGPSTVCDGVACRIDCSSDTLCIAEDGSESCCPDGALCLADGCFEPTTSCLDFVDCPVDQMCSTLGACIPRPPSPDCRAELPPPSYDMQLLWEWDHASAVSSSSNQVIMTPIVIDLDGDTLPEIVFSSFEDASYTQDGILRAIRGSDGAAVFDVTDAALRVRPGSHIAAGDIDGDGFPELVTCLSDDRNTTGPVVAFNHDGTHLWTASHRDIECSQAAGPTIADLDQDGFPEVIVRYTVINGEDGSLDWHEDCVGVGAWADGRDNPCDYTVAYDLDGDGSLEVVGGNVAFEPNGDVHYDRRGDLPDGYPAVGDLDLDGSPEVVVVYSAFDPMPYQGNHWLRALNADGTDQWGPIDINVSNVDAVDEANGSVAGGGPPVIANLDADPELEIAVAGGYALNGFDTDGTPRWGQATHDTSTRKTGVAAFDFNGDGRLELVYNDQHWLRIYSGATGNVLGCTCNLNATLFEVPVIADVNGNGSAEIVVGSNILGATNCPVNVRPDQGLDNCIRDLILAGDVEGSRGVRVFGSPTDAWASTRSIWNQHGYHVTNISLDGTVPIGVVPAHQRPSNPGFRASVDEQADARPDLVIREADIGGAACATGRFDFYVRIANDGGATAPADAEVVVRIGPEGATVEVARVATSDALLPGEAATLVVPYSPAGDELGTPLRFEVEVNPPDAVPLVTECSIDNNSTVVVGTCP